jgi:hypothetical protein
LSVDYKFFDWDQCLGVKERTILAFRRFKTRKKLEWITKAANDILHRSTSLTTTTTTTTTTTVITNNTPAQVLN